MDYFWLIIIGLSAGWFAGQFMTGKGFGMIGDLVVGVMGALVGGALFEKTDLLPGSGLMGNLIVATLCAIGFLYGLRKVRKA
jgi:uncharacterized membrane protein YeaQ/YmgE (transglycosylase-associated protein family)